MSEKKEVKFKPGVGVDVGTSNIVVVRQTEDGTFVNKFHRNMLYPLDITDESADLLERSSYFFVKVADKYYVIGEDALNLVNAIGKGNIIIGLNYIITTIKTQITITSIIHIPITTSHISQCACLICPQWVTRYYTCIPVRLSIRS